MRSRRRFLCRCAFFAVVSLAYAAVFVFLARSGLYRIENAHNDRLFSADDVYYVNNFFSTEMEACCWMAAALIVMLSAAIPFIISMKTAPFASSVFFIGSFSKMITPLRKVSAPPAAPAHTMSGRERFGAFPWVKEDFCHDDRS